MIKKIDSNTYDSSNVESLEYPENVQTRPTMYVNIGIEGVSHLSREMYDNAIDEAMNGHTDKISVIFNKDENSIQVEDGGRGIPCDNGILETLVCKLHSGAKFGNGSYKSSGGLNGVGLGCINALSDSLIIDVFKDGFEYHQEFSLGKPVAPIKKIGKTKKSGTIMKFIPNEEFLMLSEYPKEEWIDEKSFQSYIAKTSYLNKGISINFVVIKNKKKVINETYLSKNGIVDLVTDIGKVNNGLLSDNIFYINEVVKTKNKIAKKQIDVINVDVEIAIGYCKESTNDFTESYCNGIYLSEGGTHITGLRKGLTSVLKKACAESGLINKRDKDLEVNGDDVREGLICVISIKHPDPLYSSQSKQKLGNTEVQGIVNKLINDHFNEWLLCNHDEAILIYKKNIGAARGRTAAQKARDKEYKLSKNAFDSMSDISKLADCESKDASLNSIYIVEGDSASGSAKQGRDATHQAIYALRGKPLNTCDYTDISKIMNPKLPSYNKELSDLILSLGCGIDGSFDITKLRYAMIVIMADSDVDGFHIYNLLVVFIIVHCPELILQGHVYVAIAPFYIVKEGGKDIYLIDDNEYNMYLTNRIIKNFTIKVDGKKLSSTKITNLLANSKFYLTELDRLQNLYSIAPDILEFLIFSTFNNDDILDIFNDFKETYSDDFKIKIVKNSMKIKGYYNKEYYELMIDERMITDLRYLKEKFISNNLEGYEYLEILTSNGNEMDMYLGEAMNFITKYATPKYRNRIKGKLMPLKTKISRNVNYTILNLN